MNIRLVKKFTLFSIVGFALFSGSAIAAQIYLSDNTPEKGYLLCANNKTKVVTYPKKLSCPSGSTALDLGAVSGLNKNESSGYIVELKPQDIVASVNSKSEIILISKSNFKSGYYNLISEISTLFLSTDKQVILCSVKTTGNSRTWSGFPSHEVANSWTGHTSQLAGVLYVNSPTDVISVVCSFTGNAKVNYGYMSLIPINTPLISTSDSGQASAQQPISTNIAYTAFLDKAIYTPGEVATLLITGKDDSGNSVPDGTQLASSQESITTSFYPNSYAVAPKFTDTARGGRWTYRLIIGSATGTYSGTFKVGNMAEQKIPYVVRNGG